LRKIAGRAFLWYHGKLFATIELVGVGLSGIEIAIAIGIEFFSFAFNRNGYRL